MKVLLFFCALIHLFTEYSYIGPHECFYSCSLKMIGLLGYLVVVDFPWWIWVFMRKNVLPDACCGLYVFWPLLEQLRFKSVLPSSLVSDFPSQLEAFWTLSLISLGRLEYIRLFCYIISSIYTTISVMQGMQNTCPYVSLFSSFCLFFLFCFCFELPVPSAVCWPLTFPSSLSESPLLGHHSSDTARWKFTWNYSHLL